MQAYGLLVYIEDIDTSPTEFNETQLNDSQIILMFFFKFTLLEAERCLCFQFREGQIL